MEIKKNIRQVHSVMGPSKWPRPFWGINKWPQTDMFGRLYREVFMYGIIIKPNSIILEFFKRVTLTYMIVSYNVDGECSDKKNKKVLSVHVMLWYFFVTDIFIQCCHEFQIVCRKFWQWLHADMLQFLQYILRGSIIHVHVSHVTVSCHVHVTLSIFNVHFLSF